VITDALAAVRARLDAAGGTHVRLVAVTKGFDAATVLGALHAGVTDIAESYAQELLAKLPDVVQQHALDGVEVHFIGRLQSNKVRALSSWVTRWDSVDRESLVDELARRCPRARILIQVNTTGEMHKGGVPPEQVAALVDRADAAGLVVEGLMTVGPTTGGPQAARAGFELVRTLVDDLHLNVCSMGMSDDLDVAVAAGSTEVRVGSALFGARTQ
jgi:PLP dependent protein